MATTVGAQQPQSSYLSCDQALKIAREDAEKVYRDLSRYDIRLALDHEDEPAPQNSGPVIPGLTACLHTFLTP